MPAKINIPGYITGLNAAQVEAARKQYGANHQVMPNARAWWRILLEMLKEPMLLLLIAVTIIYLILGEYGEAYFMLAAIIIVSGISFYQDNRSRRALEALEKINQPRSKVIRDSRMISIPTRDIVMGDMLLVAEGDTINADGKIVHSNDFSVNESMLTGEAYSVFKSAGAKDDMVYSGTLVVSGLAICEVLHTGKQTKIGQIGESISGIREEATPLQRQIEKFVKGMAIAGILVFLLVWLVNYWESRSLTDSLLKGLTLAMSVLPEEIPVAFTTFMALGSWRLMQLGIIVKKIRIVETLGSATVICLDKTGTITQNQMSLRAVYACASHSLYENDKGYDKTAGLVIQYAMWASEPVPFDPMEKALHKAYENNTGHDERSEYTMLHEYPLEGTPPMMTHLFENRAGKRIVAAKGAPEAIIAVSKLTEAESTAMLQQVNALAEKGYRVLGVASSSFEDNNFPARQQQLPFQLLGFVAFYDPPKPNIRSVFEQFYQAGIAVKIITGDNEVTTRAIAQQAGLKNAGSSMNGAQLLQLTEAGMQEKLMNINIFTRMFPEAKLAAVNALKNNRQIVAMTGDGVNDAPALKAAHIGIAMGNKGTEIAKQAAALILSNDDLLGMVDAIAIGRRIYTNIKKAVQYIISIHIPIILTVSLPLFLGWVYPAIFTPVHVIFLELIMGPTCSVVYENEPMEQNAMHVPPRPFTATFLSLNEMAISIIQGLVITAGVLFMYRHGVQNGYDESGVRSLVFTTLVLANIFLTLCNRSFYYSLLSEMRNHNPLMVYIISATILLLMVMLYLPPVATFFTLIPLSPVELLICSAAAAVSVLWFEIWKWAKRKGMIGRK
ncbi:cation-translocating P-type ATPase [Agriterribacter sp.]|uniref:cation-translocating P-type ATPase n=1 Tax=Agriterribacter sp. TaxID=2821509 RepID=UPI002CBFEAE3|nr:cation-translocating P-type ATPase [Agriterribacter sp.]HRO46503.1 cation-translocating P-type ATPase [Agriterribacter sp.]HRQ17568.1 cation-translocating P-type ATPase [Agriterribacter sp.]